MADFPIPIGVDRMLRDIAEGIGGAARILPTVSRSEVGAVAMRRATVAIDFELSSAAKRTDDSIGLGAKTFLFGFGASTETTETKVLNHGRIEMEIVAIVEPEEGERPKTATPAQPGPPVKAPTPLSADQIRQALAIIQGELHNLPLDEEARGKIEAKIAEIHAAISAGDLHLANELLQYIKDIVQEVLNP